MDDGEMMDSAIQTNKNGIETLEKRQGILKKRFHDLEARLDSLDLGPLETATLATAKTTKINGQRIAVIRESEYQEQINSLKGENNLSKKTFGHLESQLSAIKATQQAQAAELAGLKAKISENTEIILENTQDQVATEHVLEECIAKIDKALGSVHDISINLTLIRSKLDTTDKVVDGCIIGIDKNATDVKKNAKNTEITARAGLITNTNVSNLAKVSKNLVDALDLVRVQVQTNATNIRKK